MERIFKKTTPDATVYKFRIRENGKASEVTIKRIGIEYYQRIQENDLTLIGHLKELMEWLYVRGAEWVETKKGKARSQHFFYGTEAAQQCLNLGWSVFSVEMKTLISYDDEYRLLITTEGKELTTLPKGTYAAAFTEGMKKQTKSQVYQLQQQQAAQKKQDNQQELKTLRKESIQYQEEICKVKAELKTSSHRNVEQSTELEKVRKSYKKIQKVTGASILLGITVTVGAFFLGKN